MSQVTELCMTQAGLEASNPTRGGLFILMFIGSLVNGFNIRSLAFILFFSINWFTRQVFELL